MNSTSQVVRTTRETVSLETLAAKLPTECYQSLLQHYQGGSKSELGDDVYRRYFESTPTPILTEDEKEELFETLGSQMVKGHFSTSQLRSFIEREPSLKRHR